jgi:hypothetical protein
LTDDDSNAANAARHRFIPIEAARNIDAMPGRVAVK